MLSLLCHPNLVKMIGYCAEGDQRLLVYEYMPLGSLDSHLHGITLMTSHLFNSVDHLVDANIYSCLFFILEQYRIVSKLMLLVEK